jgi:hypothetical protein
MGLVAGGMVDGTVSVWDVAAILAKDIDEDNALVSSIQKHSSGPVQAMRSLVHSIRHNSPLAEPTDKCLFSIWSRENREPAGVTNGSGVLPWLGIPKSRIF